jgi:hypothetical protein
MYCNTLCSIGFAVNGCLNHIGIIPSAGIAQCGKFVNINAEFGHNLLVWIVNLRNIKVNGNELKKANRGRPENRHTEPG